MLRMIQTLTILMVAWSVLSLTPLEEIQERLRHLEERMETTGKLIQTNSVLIANNSINIKILQSQLDPSKDDDKRIDIDDRFGLLITGGAPNGRSVWNSTELFIPSANRSCSLGELEGARQGHTSGGRGLMVCGGVDRTERPVDTCLTWTDGRWVTERRLSRKSVYHTAWNLNDSLMLMGGPSYESSRFRTEVVTGKRKSFRLKHETS